MPILGIQTCQDSSDGARVPARLVFNAVALHRALVQEIVEIDGEFAGHYLTLGLGRVEACLWPIKVWSCAAVWVMISISMCRDLYILNGHHYLSQPLRWPLVTTFQIFTHDIFCLAYPFRTYPCQISERSSYCFLWKIRPSST